MKEIILILGTIVILSNAFKLGDYSNVADGGGAGGRAGGKVGGSIGANAGAGAGAGGGGGAGGGAGAKGGVGMSMGAGAGGGGGAGAGLRRDSLFTPQIEKLNLKKTRGPRGRGPPPGKCGPPPGKKPGSGSDESESEED